MTRKFFFIYLLVNILSKNGVAQTASITISLNRQCSPLTDVKLTGSLSGGTATKWEWFENNVLINPSTTSVPFIKKNYTSDGTYILKLMVTLANGKQVNAFDTVIAYPSPVGNFVLSDKSDTLGCAPHSVGYKSTSSSKTGYIASYSWNFGSASSTNTQTNPNPDFTYNTEGNYEVSLIVMNNWGCYSKDLPKKIITVNAQPKAEFTIQKNVTCDTSLSALFNNTTQGSGPLIYKWDFGDANNNNDTLVVTTKNPAVSYLYKHPGNYSVSLAVTNSNGSCQSSFTVPYSNGIFIGKPKAYISTKDSVQCTGSYTHTGGSTPPVYTYQWIYDGINNGGNPVSNFTTIGLHNVMLIAINPAGCADTAKKKIFVKKAPEITFAPDVTTACKVPFNVKFTPASNSPTVTYAWNFGDGSATSSLISPTHSYKNEGYYSVKLTVKDPATGCTTSAPDFNYIQIGFPKIDFTFSPPSGCGKLTIMANATVTGLIAPIVPNKYIWMFGDGSSNVTTTTPYATHTYNTPGTFNISVTVQTAQGCTATSVIKNVVVSPEPCDDDGSGGGGGGGGGEGFTFAKNCNNKYNITFKDTVKNSTVIKWDFGDGTSLTTEPDSCTHLYTKPPKKPYTFIVTITRKDAITNAISTAKKKIIIIDEKANFGSILFKCSDVKLFTKGVDSSKVKSFNWDFGDSTNLTLINDLTQNGPYKGNDTIVHKYIKSGTYKIRLIITDKVGCVDSISQHLEIKTPQAFIAATPDRICGDSILVTFKDNSLQTSNAKITKWIWTYGDGSKIDTILNNNPFKHVYYIHNSSFMAYTAQLKIRDANGCESETEKTTKLYKPKAQFKSIDTLVCIENKKSIELLNGSEAYNGIYTWDYGDTTPSQSCNYRCNGYHQYQNISFYKIKLVVKDENNCKDSMMLKDYIKIVKPKADFIFNKEDTCRCAPVSISFLDASKYAKTWQWYFDKTDGGTFPNASKGFDAGHYSIKLKITGLDGCADSTVKKLHIKGPIGILKVTNHNGCAPHQVLMNVVGAKDVEKYSWDLNDNTTDSTGVPTISHTYKYPGKYLPNVVLTSPKPCVNSLNGCPLTLYTSDSITVDSLKPDFNIEKLEVCNKGKIKVFNQSWIPYFSGLDSIKWTMGDGTIIKDSSTFTHIYKSPGKYALKLEVVSRYGCRKTCSKVVEIGESPKVKIKGNDTICLRGNSQLTYEAVVDAFATTSDSVKTYKWTIDGIAVGGNQKKITYNSRVPGLHTIKLCAITNYNCDSCITKQIIVDSVKAGFYAMDTTSFCGKGKVIYINQSIASSSQTYVWMFEGIKNSTKINDTVYYPAPGSYAVALISKTKYGCTDTAKHINFINVYPSVMASISGKDLACKPELITYMDNSITTDKTGASKWYLDDKLIYNGKTLLHKFNPGDHQLKLIVNTIHNCVDSVNKNIKVDSLAAHFSVVNPINCGDSATVKFKNNSYAQFNADSLFWDFGNLKFKGIVADSISNLYTINPVNGVDKYTVSLILKSSTGCLDTFKLPAAVTLIQNPKVSILGDSLLCSPEVTIFRDTTTSYDTVDAITWYVNGNKADSSHNFKTFFHAGAYNISLKLKTKNGCKTSAIKKLVVDSLNADFSIVNRYLCGPNDTANFSNLSYGMNGVSNYYWNFGDKSTSSIKDPYHLYNISTTKNSYDVSLIIKSKTGCTDTVVKKSIILHYNYTRSKIKHSLKRCMGDTILMEAIPTLQDSILSYNWYVDNTFIVDSAKNLNHTFQTAGLHSIKLKLNTVHKCTLPLDTFIVVHTLPLPALTDDTVVCSGQELQLEAHDGIHYFWKPSVYLSSDTLPNPVASPTKSIIYNVDVINQFGCKAKDSIKITVDRPVLLNVEEEPLICSGKSVELHAYATSKKFEWSPSIGLSSTNIPNPVASPLKTTTYKVVAYSTNSCPDDSAFTTVFVGEIPELYASPDTSVLSGTTIQLFAAVKNLSPVSYLWQPSKGLSCTDCPSPFVTITENKIYTVTVNTKDNCPANHTIHLEVFCVEGLFIPNSFTPNDDNLNETFYIKGRNNSIVESMTIFNRWGDQVFKQEHFPLNNPAYGWDGSFNGNPIKTSEVFVYEIKLKCDNAHVHVIKGIVSLVL